MRSLAGCRLAPALAALLLLGGPEAASPQEGPGVALFDAAGRGDEDRVVAELRRGASVNWRDARGWTPLLVASMRGHGPVVRRLLEAGADVDAPSHEGATPLMAAAVIGDLQIARILVDSGADLGRRNMEGATAAVKAEQYGHVTVASYLRTREAEAELRLRSSSAPAAPLPPTSPVDQALVVDRFRAPYVLVVGANLRSGPGVDAVKTGSLPEGTRVWVTGKVRDRDWYRVGPETHPSFISGGAIAELSEEDLRAGTLAQRSASGAATEPAAPTELSGRWAAAGSATGCADDALELEVTPETVSIFYYLAGERLTLARQIPFRTGEDGGIEAGSATGGWRLALRGSRLHYRFADHAPVIYARCRSASPD